MNYYENRREMGRHGGLKTQARRRRLAARLIHLYGGDLTRIIMRDKVFAVYAVMQPAGMDWLDDGSDPDAAIRVREQARRLTP